MDKFEEMTTSSLYEYLENKYGEDMQAWDTSDPAYIAWLDKVTTGY